MEQEKNQWKQSSNSFNIQFKTGYWEEIERYWPNHKKGSSMQNGIWKGHYDDGKKEGFWRLYSVEERLMCEMFFKKGDQIGEHKYWHPLTGNIGTYGMYNDNGKRKGTWLWHYEDGPIQWCSTYNSNGQQTHHQEFKENGQLCNEKIFIL